jgi:hypothetical protein
MKKMFLTLMALSAIEGALPPLAQSTREITALVSDPQIQTLLGSAEPIEEIRRTEEGYALFTKSRLLQVEVEYLSNGRKIGPVSFQFHFQEPILLTSK